MCSEKRVRQLMISLCSLAVLFACTAASTQENERGREEPGIGKDPRVTEGQIAPLLEGVGEYDFKVTTNSPRAQKFCEQGLALLYAFNHAEALRAFQEAARLDPDCAMAYWGQAFALGPHLNQMMQPDNAPKAYAAIQKALELKSNATEKEQDFIDALAKRYAPTYQDDRTALDQAYADAMAKVAEKYPADDQAQTLYAESLMNLMPWNYYTRDGEPRELTPTVLATLETVAQRNPKHAGAHHFYIHATEEHRPDKSEWSADQLRGLTPAAGHLVHMPSHIYMRLGRYADSYAANMDAVKADESYITQCRQQGIYPLAYYPHNVHFMAWAAQRQGNSEEAIEGARKVSRKAQEAHAGTDFALYESFYVMPLYMLARFGKWDEILAEPKPMEDALYVQGIWHYARGMAFLNKGKRGEALQEINKLNHIMSEGNFGETTVGFAPPQTLLTIASCVLEGELLAKDGDIDEALTKLERAVRIQDGLMYNEPPDWYYPVRHTLGAVLLDAGRADEAEIVYWEDLKRNPNNGFALFGLVQALEAQGKNDQAMAIEKRFEKAWRDADHELTSSRF